MTDPEYPVTIAHGHPQGGLTATEPETWDAVVAHGGLAGGKVKSLLDGAREAAELYGGAAVFLTADDGQSDPRIDEMLRMGVVSTETEARDLIGRCDKRGVDAMAIGEVIWRWNTDAALVDLSRISEQLQRVELDLRAARRIQRRGWPKPARAGRRRSRQARSSRPRALRRAIARGLDPELAKREHWAHGGKGEP